LRKVLGRVTLTELLSEKRNQIMQDISATVKKDAEAIGVSVADVRIRRADLPIEVMQAINHRMRTERERDAKEFRAKGQQEAQNIRARADKEATIIVAEAEKNAQITRGQGDKDAVTLWNNIVGQDVNFYEFYRSLEAYRKSLADDDTSLVLSPDSEFFKYFNQMMKEH
jgi:membrane protease subunit HflC